MSRRASSKGESRRLAVDEGDWNLAGCRTLTRARGGGTGRSGRTNKEASNDVPETVVVDNGTTTTEESNVPEESSSEDDETATTAPPTSKPTHSRVIVEVSQLSQAFENYPCPCCEEVLELKLRTLCIATSIDLVCNNKDCSYVCKLGGPMTTTIHADDRHKYERMTDYALNVLYVLGFISVGDGHTEAGRLLGLLGLPNDTTMMNRSFGIIEERIGPFVRELCEEILTENIAAEAKLSMNEFDYNVWKMWMTDQEQLGPLPVERMPQIDASYDMAWQQKGSGHVYNSQSGHGTLFGRYTRKIIGLVIKSKLCSYCNTFTRNNPELEVPYHQCWKSHEGSSGSMESSGAVQVLVDAFEKKNIVIRRLCCDDDSSIRADCQWSNVDYLKNNNTDVLPMVKKKHGKNKDDVQPRPDKGKLPAHVPEPLFVADPNHRRKGLSGELIKLDSSKVDVKMTMTRMDSTRISKNFGYMARTLKDRHESEYVDAAKACLEHHFDNHTFCGNWCKRKDASDLDKQNGNKYYRSKEKDAKLYALLVDKMQRFCTQDRLDEMAHTLDTNMNEAFNQICTWFAPKNKVFAGTGSLHNRIAFAVGINSLGVEVFFKRIFKKMGIPLTENVAYYLKIKEKSRAKRLEKLKTRESKLKKNKRKYDKLAKDVQIARKEKHRREGTYRRGMNLDDPFGEGDDAQKKPTKRAKSSNALFCEFCGIKGHQTKRSKKCTAVNSVVKRFRKEDGSLLSDTAPPPPLGAATDAAVLTAAAILARQDCDRMDSMPFDAEYNSEEDVRPPFFDEDDSDDDSSVVLVGGAI